MNEAAKVQVSLLADPQTYASMVMVVALLPYAHVLSTHTVHVT
jgi:hypothetical protein